MACEDVAGGHGKDVRPPLDKHLAHTRHILPPSEIDLGLFWADFTDLEGKHLFITRNWLKG